MERGDMSKVTRPMVLDDTGKEMAAAIREVAEAFRVDVGGGASLPGVTNEDEGKVLTVVDGVWAAKELPKYEGTYEITPLANEQTTLLTAQKFMTDNVTVKEIPYFETSNQSGSTVYIGTEVEIYVD